MAILKMKKLRMLVLRSKRDELLRELIRHGCVEFSQLEDRLRDSEAEMLLRPESSALSELKAKHHTLQNALELLDRYVPGKKSLLSAKPELENNILLDDTGLGHALKKAELIEDLDGHVKHIHAEESRLRSVIESLKPWLELKLPLNLDKTERCSLMLGSIPARMDYSELVAAIESVDEEAELFLVSQDKKFRYVLFVCMQERSEEMLDCLRHFGFSPSTVSEQEGTALQCTNLAQEQIKELEAEEAHYRQRLADEAVHRDELKLASDRVAVKMSLAEAEEKFYGTQDVLLMEGWLPEIKEKEIVAILKAFDCAWELAVPEREEYPEVPVSLKNNKFTNALNMVTNMYSLPAYGSLDPNPLMAPFFILFYGLMMADMGYGLVMIIAALVAMTAIKPRGGTLSFCQLLLYGGISTFLMGALTGGFFGDALVHIGKLLGKPEGWGTLPALFSPLEDTVFVLIGSMALGLVHLNTGMVINFIKKYRRGELKEGLWEEGSLWLTEIGILLYVLGIGNVQGIPVVLAAGVLAVLYGGTRGAKGFGKLTSVFGTVYNTVTGWFGDILSYTRIMALMLAGSVIATVFNTIGAIADNIFVFALIFIVGHALNFGLNLLGCYVHDLRLQCLEYFGKFYEDGGRAFQPLEVKTKYYNPAE